MRIPSGVTDQVIYFIAVDSTDLKTRETGLTTFTVYRSRNGAAAAAMTTPTVTEVDATNMAGVYKLLLDEDMTIGSGNDSEEMIFHITQASMAPVDRTIELYRPKFTAGSTLTLAAINAECDTAITDGDIATETKQDIIDTNIDQIEAAVITNAAGTDIAADIIALKGETVLIVADTNELQTDWVNGGRLDLLLDAILLDTTEIGVAGAGLSNITLNAASIDLVWDEPLTGATHNDPTSAGRILRTLQESGSVHGGEVWVDTNNGTAGTTPYENGTKDNHVLTWADALVIAPLVGGGIIDFHIINGSSIDFTGAAVNNYSLFGNNYTLTLGGVSCQNIYVEGASVSGIGTSASGPMHFEGCHFGTASVQGGHFDFCDFADTVTFTLAGDYQCHNCYSGVAGPGSPTFAFAAVAISAEFRNWAGSITFSGLTSDDTLTIGGTLGTIDLGSPASAVVIEIRGTYKEIINVGSASINLAGAIKGADVAAILVDTILIVADTNELQTDDIPARFTAIEGATFSGATDSLEAIRNRGDAAWTTGAGGTPPHLLQSTTIATLATQVSFTLTAGSADNDAYNGSIAVITDASTAVQKAVATVSDYVGSTKTITLAADPAIFTMATGDTIEIMSALGSAGSAPTAAQNRAEMDSNSTQLAAILADTNELQGDNVPGLIAGVDAKIDIIDTNVDQIETTVITNAAGVDIAADIIAMKAETVLILADTNELQGDNVPGLIAGVDAKIDIIDTNVDQIEAAVITNAAGADIAADIIALKAETVLIVADTNELQTDWVNGGRLDLLIDSIITAVITNAAGTDIAADIIALKAETVSILADTNELQGDWVNGGRLDLILDAILVDTGTTIQDLINGLADISVSDILTTQMTESYSADGTAPTLAQAVFLMLQFLYERSVTGTTATIKKLDGSTAAATCTLDDGTDPTSITRAT
jgi:hypothetical protein